MKTTTTTGTTSVGPEEYLPPPLLSQPSPPRPVPGTQEKPPPHGVTRISPVRRTSTPAEPRCWHLRSTLWRILHWAWSCLPSPDLALAPGPARALVPPLAPASDTPVHTSLPPRLSPHPTPFPTPTLTLTATPTLALRSPPLSTAHSPSETPSGRGLSRTRPRGRSGGLGRRPVGAERRPLRGIRRGW